MTSTPSFPKCPICHKWLVEQYDQGWMVCPTKVLLEDQDLLRSKSHYLFADPVQEFIYPPFTIVLSPNGEERTDIWYRDTLPGIIYGAPNPKKLLSLPKLLNLPWDDKEEVINSINYYLIFS